MSDDNVKRPECEAHIYSSRKRAEIHDEQIRRLTMSTERILESSAKLLEQCNNLNIRVCESEERLDSIEYKLNRMDIKMTLIVATVYFLGIVSGSYLPGEFIL